MKNKYLKILVTFFILFALFTSYSYGDFFGDPKDLDYYYQNPYKMMNSEKIGNKEYHRDPEYYPWTVLANKQNAEYYTYARGSFAFNGHYADYLQAFHVLSRNSYYLEVTPVEKANAKNQWLHMKDLILLQRSIINPDNQIYIKAFPLVKLESFDNMSSLRVRNGPGEASDDHANKNTYKYLNEPIGVGKLFLYVYGVYFDEKNYNYLDNYFNIDQYNHANYYLVGLKSAFDIEEADETIMGWLPRESIVLWPTRQGLDVIPNRKHAWAHIFYREDQIQKYFIKNNQSNKYLVKIDDTIVRDTGEKKLSFCSRDLKPIVLQHPLRNKKFHLEYANIGYSSSSKSTNNKVIRSSGQKEQITLADLQELGKNPEIYFLLDGTKSMKPCFKASAIIVERIIDLLSGYNCQFYAGIYRDKNDGVHKFEEWDDSSGLSLPQWLNQVETKTFKGYDKDYQELLYYGIFQAVKRWSKRFERNIGVRMMLIIGDTGNSKYDDTSIDEIADLLQKNFIPPMALHFIHKHKKDAEKDAINQFKDDMKRVYKKLYTDHRLIPFETIDVSNIESTFYYNILPSQIKLKQTTKKAVLDFQRIITVYVKSIKSFLKQGLSEVRLGQKTIIQMICDKGFSKNRKARETCRKCKDLDSLITFVSQHRKSMNTTNMNNDILDIGYPVALLRLLGDRCPECLSYLSEKPEAGFAEGFLAVKKGSNNISRPIWLLSYKDLKRISDQTKSFINYTYSGNCEDQVHDKVIETLSVIIGQSLDIQPDEITKEQIKKWFNIVVDPERTSMLPELAKALCKDRKALKKLKKELKKVPKKIREITYDLRSERIYHDLDANPYFWVYPEELFPKINW